jgi:hypothetical protein
METMATAAISESVSSTHVKVDAFVKYSDRSCRCSDFPKLNLNSITQNHAQKSATPHNT